MNMKKIAFLVSLTLPQLALGSTLLPSQQQVTATNKVVEMCRETLSLYRGQSQESIIEYNIGAEDPSKTTTLILSGPVGEIVGFLTGHYQSTIEIMMMSGMRLLLQVPAVDLKKLTMRLPDVWFDGTDFPYIVVSPDTVSSSISLVKNDDQQPLFQVEGDGSFSQDTRIALNQAFMDQGAVNE